MNSIALIPARGGSKRIPRKNIKPFNGKPIIAYSIESALNSECFDRIIVSTDDDEIANTALSYGAEVPFIRPKELADDFATTLQVMNHAVSSLNSHQTVDQVCCIYATAPFITSKQLLMAKQQFEDKNADYAFPIIEYPSAIQRSLVQDQDGFLSMLTPKHLTSRSQDLATAYYDTGQFYWAKAEAVLKSIPIYSKKSLGIPVGKHSCVDIDDIEDWKLAEFLFKYRKQQ